MQTSPLVTPLTTDDPNVSKGSKQGEEAVAYISRDYLRAGQAVTIAQQQEKSRSCESNCDDE